MKRTLPCLALAALLAAPIASQEKRPRAGGGFNDAVGLAGGAGGKYGGRGGGRRRLAAKGGAEAASSIEDGLVALRDQRGDADHWTGGDNFGDLGTTSIAVLAYLGDGSTMRSGPFKNDVKLAGRWLVSQVGDGGVFAGSAEISPVLEHALGTYALTEIYGLSSYRLLLKHAQQTLNHLITLQNDDGGWPHRSGTASEPFTTLHAVHALVAARDFRLVGAEPALASATVWLAGLSSKDGLVSAPVLAPIADGPLVRRTAAASILFARLLVGQSPREHEDMRAIASGLLTVSKRLGDDPVCAYLGTYGLYQLGGASWRSWSAPLAGVATKAQIREATETGPPVGSWAPVGVGTTAGGLTYATAVGVLTQQAYYRFTRLVR